MNRSRSATKRGKVRSKSHSKDRKDKENKDVKDKKDDKDKGDAKKDDKGKERRSSQSKDKDKEKEKDKDGRDARHRSRSRSPRKRRKRSPTPRPTKIHIGHLTRTVNREHIMEIFSVYGTIKHVEFPKVFLVILANFSKLI